MNALRFVLGSTLALYAMVAFAQGTAPNTTSVQSQDDATIGMIRSLSGKTVAAFNAGKVDELAGMFLSQGELIDENGTIYQGEAEIKSLIQALFEQFPGTTVTTNIDSIRIVGDVAIEEGTRIMTSKDNTTKTPLRYLAVWAKSSAGWKIASHRDISEAPASSNNENLQPIAWLLGDWINEGADGSVAVSFRWSDDKNYVLGDFKIVSSTDGARATTQRIGWDANAGRIRSWLFDADGGFSEGVWTVLEDSVVIKSTSVNPDGSTSSATLTLMPIDKDHFSYVGTERIVAGSREPDFDLTIARRMPAATK